MDLPKLKKTYNDVSLDNLSRECGIDPLNVLLDKSLEEKKRSRYNIL